MVSFKPVLTRNVGKPDSTSIKTYMESGGYTTAERILKTMSGDEIIAEVKKANLRGRGGAGFPAGVKWGFIPRNSGKPKYLICNADESEPGTFKDRVFLDHDPHLLLEGIIISSYAIGSHTAFIYIRGEFVSQTRILEKAIQEAVENNFLGKRIFGTNYRLDVIVHRGAGAYICGEETGLIESLEGKRGWPRIKPPFPAIEGYLGCPTVVNNVETLTCVPFIMEKGADWFRSIGPERSPGPKLYCLSGHVNRPGVYELPMGTPLRDIIFSYGQGIRNGMSLKAVIPGGSSTPVLTAQEAMMVNMDFESVQAAGSLLGSAGIIVMDDSVCMVDTVLNLLKFYSHESCGQCTPCREGTTWMLRIVDRIEHGDGRMEDLDLLLDMADNIAFKTVCPFGDAAITPVQSFIKKFRDEWEYHIENKKCLVNQKRKMGE
jgi:NADH-quinone oxidoreductase subunit F